MGYVYLGQARFTPSPQPSPRIWCSPKPTGDLLKCFYPDVFCDSFTGYGLQLSPRAAPGAVWLGFGWDNNFSMSQLGLFGHSGAQQLSPTQDSILKVLAMTGWAISSHPVHSVTQQWPLVAINRATGTLVWFSSFFPFIFIETGGVPATVFNTVDISVKKQGPFMLKVDTLACVRGERIYIHITVHICPCSKKLWKNKAGKKDRDEKRVTLFKKMVGEVSLIRWHLRGTWEKWWGNYRWMKQRGVMALKWEGTWPILGTTRLGQSNSEVRTTGHAIWEAVRPGQVRHGPPWQHRHLGTC